MIDDEADQNVQQEPVPLVRVVGTVHSNVTFGTVVGGVLVANLISALIIYVIATG